MEEINTKVIVLIFATALIVLAAAGCQKTDNNPTGIANPASVFCEKNGGTVKIVNEEAGQRGICVLKDKTECDEWAYFRHECTETYVADKITETNCTSDEQCITPPEYLMRSSCPYTSKCINEKCAVVCPRFDGKKYYDVKECGTCPQLSAPSPDFCKKGRIADGGKDGCGCQMPPTCEAVACTMEAKLCPDGTAVGRVGPNCEFAPCPGN